MKRLVLVSRPATGGMRTHIISLLRLLDRSSWQIYLAAPQTLLDSLPHDLPPYHSLTLNIPPSTSPPDFALAAYLAAAVRGMRSDTGEWPIVHAHGLRAAWVGAWANLRASFPFVATLHNIPVDKGLARAALGFIAKYAAQIVCVSQSVADRVPGKNKRIIPNGIDLTRFARANRASARQELRLDPDSFVVAAAARLSHEKGIDLLLHAAKGVPDITFLVAGSGPEERPLADSAPKNVRLLGRIENVEILFAACDIAAMPSRSEGQGIAALEAMAAGAPLVATKVGGLGEMVRDEETALVVPPNDAKSLLDAIIRLRDNPDLRRRLGEAGRDYATRHADVNDMIAALEEVYEAARLRT